MTLRMLIALLVFLSAFATPGVAQEATHPGEDIFAEGPVAPILETQLDSPAVDGTPLVPGRNYDLVLEAKLTQEGEAVTDGIVWRIFAAQTSADGELPLVLETPPGGTAGVRLPPGDYLVHAAFGRAGATKRVTIADDDQMESLVLNAGGVILDSEVGEGNPIPPERLLFEIMQENENGDLVTVVPQASAGRLIRLSAGTYHVVSRYGGVNAIVRADIEVEAGKLTEAIMRHTGAEVTLKLVSEEGGEALANTSWTVTTQDGITVHESIGAFPSIVLAAGAYTAIATHQSEIYSRDFAVEPGIERDIEVRLDDLVRPETGTLVKPGETTAGPPQD